MIESIATRIRLVTEAKEVLGNLPGDAERHIFDDSRLDLAGVVPGPLARRAVGFGLVAVGGLLAVATSETVVRGLESLRDLLSDDPDPIADGGSDE